MSNFANLFGRISDTTLTENGGLAYSTTSNALLDLFATIGAMRWRDVSDVITMWHEARQVDRELADNLVLYTRNIREGGLGERKIARALLKELATLDPKKVIRNFDKIVDAGRWDDLFCFIDTPAEGHMWQYLEAQLRKDIEDMNNGKAISLLAKWMKSINTSSAESRAIAKKTCIVLGLTEAKYRKTLAKLRAYLRVLETKMSAGRWNEIDFSSVPSNAMTKYVGAFNRHCAESFSAYKESLAKGETKVNASTLYPYDVVRPYFKNMGWDTIWDEQWKALPNYLTEPQNVVCICDVSGSMWSCDAYPISTCVGLGIYFAQHNTGDFHNLFMGFSEDAKCYRLKDEWTLEQCIKYVDSRNWGWNTNLDKAYKQIFDISAASGESPKALVIVSDMEIDSWNADGDSYALSITEKWSKTFTDAGLTFPKLIYWNVCARNNHFLAQTTDNVAFVSGQGIGPFKNFTTLIEKSAYEAMVDILSKDVFAWR